MDQKMHLHARKLNSPIFSLYFSQMKSSSLFLHNLLFCIPSFDASIFTSFYFDTCACCNGTQNKRILPRLIHLSSVQCLHDSKPSHQLRDYLHVMIPPIGQSPILNVEKTCFFNLDMYARDMNQEWKTKSLNILWYFIFISKLTSNDTWVLNNYSARTRMSQ